MSQCACGNAVAGGAAQCVRCEALQMLGLTADASDREIEKAYKLLVKGWHPDRFPGDEKLRQAAEEKLKDINAAHASLASDGPAQRPPRATSAPPRQNRTTQRPAPPTQSEEKHRPPRQRRWRFIDAQGWIVRALVLLCILGGFGVLLKVVDSYLESDPTIAPLYVAYKSSVLRSFRVNANRVWGGLRQNFPEQTAAPAVSGPDQAPASTASPQRSPAPGVPRIHGVQPYVTAGLTRQEVVGVLGPPTSSSEQALTYGASVLYLRNDRVAGWKIDAVSAPLRVKMWPRGPVRRDLAFFTIGSTRDEVIALQGTPTMLFNDKLGYGRSEVFFDADRVIGWKNDPSSVPLRIPPR